MDARIPEDYAIDAMAMEADRRSRVLGRPYSYGQLIADTTRGQREEMAESYKQELRKAQRKGRYRVNRGAARVREDTEAEIRREFRRMAEDEEIATSLRSSQ